MRIEDLLSEQGMSAARVVHGTGAPRSIGGGPGGARDIVLAFLAEGGFTVEEKVKISGKPAQGRKKATEPVMEYRIVGPWEES